MAEMLIKETTLTSIADAIRTKKWDLGEIPFENFVSEIKSLTPRYNVIIPYGTYQFTEVTKEDGTTVWRAVVDNPGVPEEYDYSDGSKRYNHYLLEWEDGIIDGHAYGSSLYSLDSTGQRYIFSCNISTHDADGIHTSNTGVKFLAYYESENRMIVEVDAARESATFELHCIFAAGFERYR